MIVGHALVGRDEQLATLTAVLADTRQSGRGGLVLLAGEAGVGKTRLVHEALRASDVRVLSGAAGPATAVSYGPIISALRALLRQDPSGLVLDARLGQYLPLLLPELGPTPAEVDRATLFEAVHAALAGIGRSEPTVIVLDDLQDADHATLDLLAYLASTLGDVPLLVLGAYRSDELRRDHPLRRLRAELRRAGQLHELTVEPLDAAGTRALAEDVLGAPPDTQLAAILHERTDGVPLFVEELVAALRTSDRLQEHGGSWRLNDPALSLPVPDTIRDMVLLCAHRLSPRARAALDIAAVCGVHFESEVVDALAGQDDALREAHALGFVVEGGPLEPVARFRHGLIRDAFYHEIPWPRRRELHRLVGGSLARHGAAPAVLAEHWLAGRVPERARLALLQALDAAAEVHAYRDAAALAARALELWPEGELEHERLATLDRLGRCAQVAGDLTTAAATWREVAEAYGRSVAVRAQAQAWRRLAGVYELQGAWDSARVARVAAADGFAASGEPGEAAAERLAAAGYLRLAASFEAALHLLSAALGEARAAGRVDLEARILGLDGNIRARTGQYALGTDQTRQALALALEHNLSAAAADVYQRLADALEHAGDYRAARDTYRAAVAFCDEREVGLAAQLCRACMSAVLRQTGEWDACVSVCAEVLVAAEASAYARAAALGNQGLVRVLRGEAARARPLLLEAYHQAARIELVAVEMLSTWGLAMVDGQEGRTESAMARCASLLERWAATEERHYAIPALRWATSYLVTQRQGPGARACANALAQIVADTGAAEAVAGLGHALGELSLLDGDPAQAARQFDESIAALARLDLPHELAHTRLRAGVALIAAGQREHGIEQLSLSYRSAHSLGARPLANGAAHELNGLGEALDERLGRRAAGMLERGGLTRRELEVLRLVGEGWTDREIAQTLVLSPRTVEMHVAHCLNKLGCRSRAEAVRRAAELQLLSEPRVRNHRSGALRTR